MAKFNRYRVDVRFKWYSDTFTNTFFISSEKSVEEVATLLRDKINRKYAGYGWTSEQERLHDGLDPIPPVKSSSNGQGCSVDWGTWHNCNAFHKRFTVNHYKAPAFPIFDEETNITVA
jgi:hypothetical protein